LNLDEPYSKELFTILIWSSDRAKFGAPEIKIWEFEGVRDGEDHELSSEARACGDRAEPDCAGEVARCGSLESGDFSADATTARLEREGKFVLPGTPDRNRTKVRPKGATPTLLKNFQREALSLLHARPSQDRADGVGRASLAADYFTEIARVYAQLEHGNLFAFDRTNLNLVGVIHEGLCDCLY
jgi:hypothetical protein